MPPTADEKRTPDQWDPPVSPFGNAFEPSCMHSNLRVDIRTFTLTFSGPRFEREALSPAFSFEPSVYLPWLADKINVPEKALSLPSSWEVKAVSLYGDSLT
jgi:hypothetical protein